jgi:hypothetical protein
MDQKTIIEALQKALADGSGTLDDLDNLLKRAQTDIAKVKDEEKAAKAKAEAEKRQAGQRIAELANRLLEGKPTDDDCALVVNAWMKSRGIDGTLTGKDLDEIFTKSDAASKKMTADLDKALEDLTNSVKEWCGTLGLDINVKQPKPAAKPKKEDPNDVIDDFLRTFGLR